MPICVALESSLPAVFAKLPEQAYQGGTDSFDNVT